MQLAILGALEVRDEHGVAVEIAGARLRALLVRLALDAGRPVAASVLSDAVWGERMPADATNALQTLVSRLRRTLGDASAIVQSAAGYRLAIASYDVDAHRFERLASDGAAAMRAGDARRAHDLLTEALALWRGPALVDGGEACELAAARLSEVRLNARIDRAAAELQVGDADRAATELEALAREYPLNERLFVQLLTALAMVGRQADALRYYEQLRVRLADDLGVDPSADLQALHLRLVRGELDPGPREPVTRTNLKAQLTSFVGREDDVLRVGKALAESRLVTLVGPGGAGKTRLAAEAAARIDAADGVWLVELAPVTDPADVAQAALGSLGLRELHLLDPRATRSPRDAQGRLVDVLTGKQTVLVLDNCEHVIEASAHLAADLLERCADLRVLTTSREPLGIFGEVVLAVPPLGHPDHTVGASGAVEFPAVRLFIDRTAAVRPDFLLDDSNVTTVIDIVRRLDGLPLAIELAAARMRTMPLPDIATRLSDRFRLLTGGSRTALPRHRTLRAVVEWSWDLLTADERRLVERLAVFPAGVTVEGATAVSVGLTSDDVADVLASLVDKSLLQRVGDGQRVRMLETIREYGIERLAERGELADIRRRHADYFGSVLDQAQPHLTRATQLPWFERLTVERDNILSALRFRCDDGDADGALQIATSFGGFAMLMGNHAEISSWMGDALAVQGGADEGLRVVARALAAMHSATSGSSSAQVDHGMQELKIAAVQVGEVDMQKHPLVALLRPAVAFFAGEPDLVDQYTADGLQSEDPWIRAAVRMLRANFFENDGDVAAMRTDAEEALAQFRALGERWGMAGSLRMVAQIATLDGDLDAAQAAYEEALELMAEMHSQEDEAFLYVHLGELAARRGDVDAARTYIVKAGKSAEANRSEFESAFTLSMLAEMERQAGGLRRARELHDEAWGRLASMPATHPIAGHGRAITLALSARLSLDEGNVARAVQLGEDAYHAAVGTKDLPIVAAVGVTLADIATKQGNAERAAQLLGASARLRGADDTTALDIARLTADLRAELGDGRYASAYQYGRSMTREDAIAVLSPDETGEKNHDR